MIRRLLSKALSGLMLLSIAFQAFADDLFATGWGQAFKSSAEGQMVFVLLQVVGIFACIKSLKLAHDYNKGKQTTCGNWRCASMFIAGTLIYYMPETANLVYNSFKT